MVDHVTLYNQKIRSSDRKEIQHVHYICETIIITLNNRTRKDTRAKIYKKKSNTSQ